MKIVVTNWSGLTDLHIERLRKLGEVEVYEETTLNNIEERSKGADVLIADMFITPLQKDDFEKIKHVKYISLNTIGHELVDSQSAGELGIKISHIPSFCTDSVAELNIGLMFAVAKNIVAGDHGFRGGLKEVIPGTPDMDKYMSFDFRKKTLGVVGLGGIGTRVAEIGMGLGMNVIAYNRTQKNIEGARMVSLEELAKESDVVSINISLTPETEGIFTKEHINSMKPTSILVNTARAEVVDEEALIEALNSGKIAGAGTDVSKDVSTDTKNVVFTPHIGFNSRESLESMAHMIVENVEAYVSGNPINLVN